MIEIGEYIRTDKGIITKINSGVDIDMLEFENAIIGNIKAHSKNIIDLIEVGDYVNGHKVYRIDSTNAISIETETNLYGIIYAETIKTILTHEQYEQNCYKVGDIE